MFSLIGTILFFPQQFGAMVVHLPGQAGFFLAMTAEQHRTCFLSLKKSVLQYPSSEQYRSHFKRLWENGMNTANEEISEASWRTLGRVLSPLYFGSRDWVPIIPARLRKLHADHWTERIKGMYTCFCVLALRKFFFLSSTVCVLERHVGYVTCSTAEKTRLESSSQ